VDVFNVYDMIHLTITSLLSSGRHRKVEVTSLEWFSFK